MNHRVYCAVYGCMNSSKKKPGLTYFTLPGSAERRSKWLRLICRLDLANKPPRGYVVCENHFDPLDILPGTHRKRLKTDSLPCLLLPDIGKKYEWMSANYTPPFDNKVEKYVQTNSLPFLHFPDFEKKDVPISDEPPKLVEKYVQTDQSLECLLLPDSEKRDPWTSWTPAEPTFVEKYVQTDYSVTISVDACSQTYASLSSSSPVSPRKRKIESDPLEDRNTNKELETEKCDRKLFHELCNKFLTKELAEMVKAQLQ